MKRAAALLSALCLVAFTATAQEVSGTDPVAATPAAANPQARSLQSRVDELEARLATCKDVATEEAHPAYVPAPRYSGMRTMPEQRLTCADYSDYYFQHHPAMARVCNVGVEPAAPMEEPEAAADPDIITVSATSVISSTL